MLTWAETALSVTLIVARATQARKKPAYSLLMKGKLLKTGRFQNLLSLKPLHLIAQVQGSI
jgi:hypothetical protein